MLFMRYSKDCSYFLRVPRFCKRKIIDTDGWAYLAACNVWSGRQMVYQINKWKKGGWRTTGQATFVKGVKWGNCLISNV